MLKSIINSLAHVYDINVCLSGVQDVYKKENTKLKQKLHRAQYGFNRKLPALKENTILQLTSNSKFLKQ